MDSGTECIHDWCDPLLREFLHSWVRYVDGGGDMGWPEYRNRCVDLLVSVLEH